VTVGSHAGHTLIQRNVLVLLNSLRDNVRGIAGLIGEPFFKAVLRWYSSGLMDSVEEGFNAFKDIVLKACNVALRWAYFIQDFTSVLSVKSRIGMDFGMEWKEGRMLKAELEMLVNNVDELLMLATSRFNEFKEILRVGDITDTVDQAIRAVLRDWSKVKEKAVASIHSILLGEEKLERANPAVSMCKEFYVKLSATFSPSLLRPREEGNVRFFKAAERVGGYVMDAFWMAARMGHHAVKSLDMLASSMWGARASIEDVGKLWEADFAEWKAPRRVDVEKLGFVLVQIRQEMEDAYSAGRKAIESVGKAVLSTGEEDSEVRAKLLRMHSSLEKCFNGIVNVLDKVSEIQDLVGGRGWERARVAGSC